VRFINYIERVVDGASEVKALVWAELNSNEEDWHERKGGDG
jgi:hypothetical protein